jgi:AbrB family looped-hinge helix DNA binding protein
MSKVTSKLQVTIPKAIADRHGVRPGDEVRFVSAGDTIRLERPQSAKSLSVAERLRLFDAATRRQRKRDAAWGRIPTPKDRGWTREELYTRGRSR